jgi:hypothetical protein
MTRNLEFILGFLTDDYLFGGEPDDVGATQEGLTTERKERQHGAVSRRYGPVEW